MRRVAVNGGEVSDIHPICAAGWEVRRLFIGRGGQELKTVLLVVSIAGFCGTDCWGLGRAEMEVEAVRSRIKGNSAGYMMR